MHIMKYLSWCHVESTATKLIRWNHLTAGTKKTLRFNTRNTPFPAPEMVPFTFRKGPTTGVTLSPSSPWCPLKSVLCGSLLKLAHAFAWHVLLGYLKLPFFFPICYVQFISRNDEPIGILVGLFLCYVFLLLPCRVTDNQFRFDHAYPCFSGKKRLFQSLRPKNMYYVSLPLYRLLWAEAMWSPFKEIRIREILQKLPKIVLNPGRRTFDGLPRLVIRWLDVKLQPRSLTASLLLKNGWLKEYDNLSFLGLGRFLEAFAC